MIRSILAVSEGGPDAVTTFGLARRMAGLFGAAVDALHVADESGGGGMGFSLLTDPDRVASRAADCERRYREILADLKGSTYTAEAPDDPIDWLVTMGRRANLIVVGRPGEDSPNIAPDTVRAAIHDCARPVLVAPPRPSAGAFRRAVLAWNGSAQAARAVGYAIPFLKRASDVIVLAVGQDPKSVPPAGLLRYLDRHGIDPVVDVFDPGAGSSRARGRALLAYTHDHEADLLVMGAYGGGMLKTFLGVGGATSKVISSCRVPLLVAH
jgi:nucleotide-binding universal stress UspA family protein